MTVYVATTMKHFQKIADFMERQPVFSHQVQHTRHCVVSKAGDKITARKIQALTKKPTHCDIIVVEDVEGNIRFVAFREYSKVVRKGKKVIHHSGAILDNVDWQTRNWQYLMEALEWSFPHTVKTLGVDYVEHFMPKPFLDFFRAFMGDDCIELLSTVPTPVIINGVNYGQYYHVRLNHRRYLAKITRAGL